MTAPAMRMPGAAIGITGAVLGITGAVEIRRARAGDAEVLTRLAHAAKRHWRYPDEWIELWRSALTITPDFIDEHLVYCAEHGGAVIGFYALTGTPPARELEHMWVTPEQIGRGLGARLLRHATATMRDEGTRTLRIESDPNAEAFYVKHGARRVGDVPSTPAGRTLPVLMLDVTSGGSER